MTARFYKGMHSTVVAVTLDGIRLDNKGNAECVQGKEGTATPSLKRPYLGVLNTLKRVEEVVLGFSFLSGQGNHREIT